MAGEAPKDPRLRARTGAAQSQSPASPTPPFSYPYPQPPARAAKVSPTTSTSSPTFPFQPVAVLPQQHQYQHQQRPEQKYSHEQRQRLQEQHRTPAKGVSDSRHSLPNINTSRPREERREREDPKHRTTDSNGSKDHALRSNLDSRDKSSDPSHRSSNSSSRDPSPDPRHLDNQSTRPNIRIHPSLPVRPSQVQAPYVPSLDSGSSVGQRERSRAPEDGRHRSPTARGRSPPPPRHRDPSSSSAPTHYSQQHRGRSPPRQNGHRQPPAYYNAASSPAPNGAGPQAATSSNSIPVANINSTHSDHLPHRQDKNPPKQPESEPPSTHARTSAQVLSAPMRTSPQSAARGYCNPFDKSSQPSTTVSIPAATAPAAGSTVLAPSTSTGPIETGQKSSRSHQDDSQRVRSKSRHRSKSRARSRGGERGREEARSRSKDRGRSKSRARSKIRTRSKSRGRSRSRPVRSRTTMGVVTRRRSRSRALSGSSDNDDGMSDMTSSDGESATSNGYSDSDSDDSRGRRKRGRRTHRRAAGDRRRLKKRRYYSPSDSDDSALEVIDDGGDSDLPLVQHISISKLQSTSGTSVVSRPSDLATEMKDMLAEMKRVINKSASRLQQLRDTASEMEAIHKRYESSLQEWGKELSRQQAASVLCSDPIPTPGERPMPSQIEPTETPSRPFPGSRSRTNSYQGGLDAPSAGRELQGDPRHPKSVCPMPPPPSLKPVPASSRAKTESGVESSGMVMIRVPTSHHRANSQPVPTPHASGYRRVFERINYQLPISKEPTMAVLSITSKTIIPQATGHKNPRPLAINPFSHGTRFEGIAAFGALDGSVRFWNIDTQKPLLSIWPKESRIIPFPEALTWVSEDTIAVVSYLRKDDRWPDALFQPSDEAILENRELPEPTLRSAPEAQTTLITIRFKQDGSLTHHMLTITSGAHKKAITGIAAALKEDYAMTFITAGLDGCLFHWKFLPRDVGNENGVAHHLPAGLDELHRLHSNTVNAVAYSHAFKTVYSGGNDKKFISYDLQHESMIHQQRVESVLHITPNPVDPRINAITLHARSEQYILMDDRTPREPVLKLGYPSKSKLRRVSVPSWHTEGGLFCAGSESKGVLNIWDVRWSGIKNEFSRRPGVGVVTGEVDFDNVVTLDGGASRHPIFSKPTGIRDFSRRSTGLPSQLLNFEGSSVVVQAAFHPTRNVMIVQNTDKSLAFMDYKMRIDPVV